MNALTKYVAAPLAKALTAMRHGGQPLFLQGLLKRTRFDYVREVGDGLDSSVVTAPIMWVQRALPEATLAVRRKKRDGSTEDLDDHLVLQLVRNPNEFYGDIALWMATVLSFLIDGNAYWIKVRNGYGRPVELWWVPWWMIEPKAPSDGSDFLSHYEYAPGTGYGVMKLAVEDVVHFRHGINPRNIRKGLSPIWGVLREIFIDLESSNFIASLLRNMGAPGVIISPKGGVVAAPDDVEATKTWFKEAFRGDNRGGPMVMGAATEVSSFGFNPEQMNLSYGSDRAEERVCACIGVPAAVVGFGAGLQQTKVGATMEELRKLAWHNGVLPLARSLVDELGRSLLPDFQRGRASDGIELYWNTDDVLALQEDEDKQTERKLKEFEAGAITLWDYLTETGREADDSHKYYLRAFAKVEVPLAEAGRPRKIAPVPAPEPGADPVSALPSPGKARTATGTKEDDHDGHGHADLSDAPRASAEAVKKGEAFLALLQRQEKPLRTAFEKPLERLFGNWGDRASAATVQVLTAHGEKALKPAAPEGQKADDDMIAEILALLDTDGWREELRQAYGAHYLTVAEQVVDAAEQAGLGTMLPDPIARAVVATGGKRVGLIDIDGQTRKAVFDALAEGRSEGEGVQALANRIANHVEGGFWNDGMTRARVIARTETKFAQNLSTIEAAKAAGVDELIVFDGRLGPGRSLEEHIARNGSIVSIADGLTMAEEEHPNGTLSFAPHFAL